MVVKVCVECGKETNKPSRDMCINCYARYRRSKAYVRKYPPITDMLSDYQNEILDGLMLGDGGLCMATGYPNGNPRLSITRAFKDHDYLMENYEVFKGFCSTPPRSVDYIGVGGTPLQKSSFGTRHVEAFRAARQRWYPDGIKLVPNDLKLTSLVISIWLADDGHISKRTTKKSSQGRLHTTFNSQSFTKEDNEFLIALLRERYNEVFSLGMQRSKYVITAADTASRVMYRDIDASFPQSMTRKALWRDPDVRLWEDVPSVRFSFIEGKAADNRVNALVGAMKEMKHATPSEVAFRLGWTNTMNNGRIEPDRGSTIRYLNRLVDMELVVRDSARDHTAHKGFVYHWKEATTSQQEII
jgi:LAGLIDADG DNA endonuclease family protein